ncbi:hypothetical protein ACA910_009401 [Epithemia clementina (nom. ined.)]
MQLPSNPTAGRKRSVSRRHQPSAASTVSSQLDRPYIFAFLALLVIYMMVTLLTYEKLSRKQDDHTETTEGQEQQLEGVAQAQQVGNGNNSSNQRRGKQDSGSSSSSSSSLASASIINTKTADYLQHHSFPLHVTAADSEWINHPGLEWVSNPSHIPNNLPRKVFVPKFWSDVYASYYNQTKSVREFLGNGKRVMTPQEAALIGSYSSVSQDGSDGDGGGMLETIYCSVASYRDYECTPTVQDIYERAKYPERIRVAVIDQSISGTDEPCLTPPKPCAEDPEQVLCKYRHLMDYYHLDAQLAVGPVFARHLAHRLYRGEYYAMQVDSHVRFTEHWDVNIIQQWKSAKNEYAVLTTYLSDINGRIAPRTHAGLSPSRPIMCNSDFEGSGDMRHLRHGQQPEGAAGIHGQPTLEPFWAAGFSFARGHFVIQVPYDQYLPMVFQGEEISIGLRGFTYGYDYYAPEEGVCFHIYAAMDKSHRRNKVPMFWENTNVYTGAGMAAMKRLNSIIGMARVNYPESQWPQQDKEQYGLGSVRTTDKFFNTFGIHIKEQKIEQHLCRFVGKPMMKVFLPALRSDRMGIDYSQINFEYVDEDAKRQQEQQQQQAKQ